MIEIIFLCILAILIYRTPNQLVLFYDNVLGKISTIALLLLIFKCCGIPSSIIFILIIIVINLNLNGKENNIKMYDYRNIFKETKIKNITDKDDNKIENITNFNTNNVTFFNKERLINANNKCKEVIQTPV